MEQAGRATRRGGEDLAGFIGSDESCHIYLHGPDVSPVHAAFRREGDRLFILDCNSEAGTYVNGIRLKPNRRKEITRHDELFAGRTPIYIADELFLGRAAVGLWTSRLWRSVVSSSDHSRVLCNGVFLCARPNSLTALIGPSGSGKTVLMGLFNGYDTPDIGRVVVGQQAENGHPCSEDIFDVHRDYASVRDFIGYVPQDDLMIAELTVRETLDYRLRLRYPSMDSSVRRRLIEETSARLGLGGKDNDGLLDRVIGAPQWKTRGLSGGERKRVNIALELVTNPLILFLDEPTSGLSSIEANNIVHLIRELSVKEELTIIASVHQPSQRAIDQFDNLLVLSYEGQLAYCGPVSKAADHFERVTGRVRQSRNLAEYILELIDDDKERALAVEAFSKDSDLPAAVLPPLSECAEPSTMAHETRHHFAAGIGTLASQWWTLVQRNFRVLSRDRTSLVLLFGQVPIIALLLLCVFHNFTKADSDFDGFSRRVYFFQELKAPKEARGESVPAEAFYREAADRATKETHLISEITARNRASILFLLVASSIWFGMIGSCGEIVTELHIAKREVRSCLRRSAYLAAKMAVIFVIVGAQTGLLTVLVVPALLTLPWHDIVALWVVLWLTAGCAVSLGLLVSSCSSTYRAALTAVPLILLPQLMFGGLIRPPADLPAGYWLPKAVGDLTIQRWAFEAALTTDAYAPNGVLQQRLAAKQQDVIFERYGVLNIVRFSNISIIRLFFGEGHAKNLLLPVSYLVLQTAIFLIGGYLVLRTRLPAS